MYCKYLYKLKQPKSNLGQFQQPHSNLGRVRKISNEEYVVATRYSNQP